MKPNSTRAWLARKSRHEMILAAGSAVALVLIGLMIVFLTFWAIYGIVGFGFHWLVPISHRGLLITAGVVTGLLFVGNATTAREYLDHIELELSPTRRLEVAVAQAGGYGWGLAFAGPKTARSTVKMFTTLLYTGPRMLTAAYYELHRAVRLKRMDVDQCAPLISMALAANGRVPFTAMLAKYPTLQPETVVQLKDLDGVVFLWREPPGITLAPRLADELIAWRTGTAS